MSISIAIVRLPTISDRAVIDLLSGMVEGFPNGSFDIKAPGISYGTFETKTDFISQHERDWSASRILSGSSATISEPDGSWVTVTFRRSVTESGGQTVPSQWETELEIRKSNSNPPSPSADTVEYVWDAIERLRKSVTKGRAVSETGGALRDVLSKEISELGELHLDIVRRADEARHRREEELERKRSALEEDFRLRTENSEKVLSAERERLQDDIYRLEERSRQLDDRAHMHARRELRGEITANLAERLQRPGVSTNALLLRGGVVGAIVVGFLATSWISLTAAQEVSQLINTENSALLMQQSPPSRIALYATLVRLAVSSAVAVALIFYLIGWLRRILEQDEKSERELERYRYDIDRATWAIETILEVQGKEGAEIPHEWVKGVTHGLFESSPSKNEETSALEAVGALLNISAKAELGPGGPRFEINRSGLRRLGKQAEQLDNG